MEHTLVQRLKNRDVDSYSEVIKIYGERLYGIICGMVRTHQDTEDILQETMLKIYTKIDSFREESSLFTWICRIAINLCLAHIEKTRINAVSLNEIVEEPRDRLPSPPEMSGISEMHKYISKCIESLPPQQKAAVILHDIERLDHKEAAQVLGCTEGTMWSRLSRAHETLRKMLHAYMEEYK